MPASKNLTAGESLCCEMLDIALNPTFASGAEPGYARTYPASKCELSRRYAKLLHGAQHATLEE